MKDTAINPPPFRPTYPSISATFCSTSGCALLCFPRYQSQVSAATGCYPTESQAGEKSMVCPHSPYLPDLAPCDFQLVPKVKMNMRREHLSESAAATQCN